MHSKAVFEKAKKLREEGYSYTIISEKTGVSRGTLFKWLSDVECVHNKEVVKKMGYARFMSGEKKRFDKENSIRMSKIRAKNILGHLNERDLLMLGLGLYVGEGTKHGQLTRVVNSDPRVIKRSVEWFEKIFDLSEENFSIRLHLYPDNNEEESIDFWSNKTGLLRGNFKSSVVDHRPKTKRKNKKTPYGTAHLTINSCGNKDNGVFLKRTIMSMIDFVL